MVKKITTLVIFTLLSFGVFGQDQFAMTELDTLSFKSDRLYLDVDFNLNFDNTEYLGSGLGNSETLFGITLTPALRYEWNGKHNLSVGVSGQKWFGSTRFLDDIDLVAYYQFRNENYGAVAGLFQRNKLIGRYSGAFFSNSWLADNNIVQGLALQYNDKVGFVEMAMDWNGMFSATTREQFYALVSGEGHFAKVLYAGASAEMHHYSQRADMERGVVDIFLLNPYIGANFKAFFDFDIRLGYLQAFQRDRYTRSGWINPMGGELLFRMSRWGAFISNNLYMGNNLLPLYNIVAWEGTIYGADLYASDPFYGTTTGIYNRTGIGYERNFWMERIKVKGEMVLKTVGKKLYYQQLVSLGVNIDPKLYDKNNKRNK